MSNRLSLYVMIILLFIMGSSIQARQRNISVRDNDLASKYLRDVRLEAHSISELFSDLAFSYEIPIGLQMASENEHQRVYRFDFKQGTLRDLLTEFFREHDQYTWEIKDGVVNVFVRDHRHSALFGELLETKVSNFSVRKKTSCWNLIKSLVSTSEIKQSLEAKGITYRDLTPGGFYIPQVGDSFTLEVSDMSLKSVLNAIVRESPSAKFWLLLGDSDNQTVSIGLSARFVEPSN